MGTAMQTIVFVEKIGKKKYRASTSLPVSLETEGVSQEQALERIYELAKKKLAEGRLIQMNLSDLPEANPWRAYAGIWKGHPEFYDFQCDIESNRKPNHG
jgi:hypothetical protein